ncbi:hypothetical protein XMD564_001972 [Marinobacterium sp. xm-d-564]|nr:hypothetical protein [Marinobacterium sp. xm-d-564]
MLGYIPLLGLSMVLMLARSLVQAQVLNVEEYASYNVSLLISSSFCVLGALGLQSISQRDLPLYLKQGKLTKSLKNIAQAIIVTLFLGVFFLLIWVFTYPSESTYSGKVVGAGLAHGALQQTFLLLTIFSRSNLMMVTFSMEYLSRSILVFFAGYLASICFETASTTILVEAIATLLVCSFIFIQTFVKNNISTLRFLYIAALGIRKVRWKEPLGLMMLMLVSFGAENIDRWLSVFFLDKPSQALYSFSMIIVLAAQSFQVVLNSSLYPILAQKPERMKENYILILKIAFTLIISGFLCYIPFSYFLEFYLPIYFADYVDILNFFPLVYTLAIIRVSDFWSSYLLICRRERILICIALIGIFNFIISLSFIKVFFENVGSINMIYYSILTSVIINYILLLFNSARVAYR